MCTNTAIMKKVAYTPVRIRTHRRNQSPTQYGHVSPATQVIMRRMKIVASVNF